MSSKKVYVFDQQNETLLQALCSAVSCGSFYVDEKYITVRENYDVMLFVYIEGGQMYLEYNGTRNILYKGEAFFIDCLYPQIYGTYGDKCELIFLHFEGGPSKYFFREIVKKHDTILKGYCAVIIQELIEDIIGQARSYLNKRTMDFSARITAALYDIFGYEPRGDSNIEHAANIFRKAVKSGNQITVGKVAESLGYSKCHLTRKFSSQFGCSPYEYILRLRIERAKDLLINTSLLVGEIALDCGFFDTSHMTNCFKKREKISPKMFRIQWNDRI